MSIKNNPMAYAEPEYQIQDYETSQNDLPDPSIWTDSLPYEFQLVIHILLPS